MEWVKCSERMPESSSSSWSKTYYVTVQDDDAQDDGEYRRVYEARYINGEWLDGHYQLHYGTLNELRIIAWMDVEPYKGEE